jgi:hypothetical protein
MVFSSGINTGSPFLDSSREATQMLIINGFTPPINANSLLSHLAFYAECFHLSKSRLTAIRYNFLMNLKCSITLAIFLIYSSDWIKFCMIP